MFIRNGYFYTNIFISNINLLFSYFQSLTSKFHRSCSFLGLITFIFFIIQCLSGIMVSFSLMNDCMLIAISREIEDMDDLYVEDFWWLHERGVDYLYIFSYLHLFRKFYLNSFVLEQEISWKSGIFMFLIFQVTTFLGLSLCCTHLSAVTLSIASGILQTLTMKIGKIYWILFTNQTLNTDTIIRLMYLHYISAFYILYLAFIHSIDMHYDWKDSVIFDGIDTQLSWFDETFKFELSGLIDFILCLYLICFYLFSETEALSYEIFMWGDIGLINDIRFYGVAPHWYFRAFMGWLIICPHHYIGIFGLISFFILWYYQPNIKNNNFFFLNNLNFYTKYNIPTEYNFFFIFFFYIFILNIIYCKSCLPFGRFYNRLGGNIILLFSYFYTLFFLSFNFCIYNVYKKVNLI